jgi:uncharacterized protein
MSYETLILKHFKKQNMATQIYINLPVTDLKRSMDFFSKLGFTFNPQFTNDEAACMVIGNDIYVMLLVQNFFKSFIKKEICDSQKSSEVILALSAESKQHVDDLVSKASSAGGTIPTEKQDQGWMYSHGFQDLDGHLWETVYMDPSAIKQK